MGNFEQKFKIYAFFYYLNWCTGQKGVCRHKEKMLILITFEAASSHNVPSIVSVGATLKRRSSTGKRKSKSPSKAKVAEDMAQSKVLTPSSKPPQPVFSDDIENQFPENMAASSATKCVSRRRSSFKKDMTPSKILTPKVNLWSIILSLLKGDGDLKFV